LALELALCFLTALARGACLAPLFVLFFLAVTLLPLELDVVGTKMAMD
jgi:membrane protein YqaA with SNARE-associated domain